ncbi:MULTISPECIES: HK97-gp10 family putative phage morphogenesis protein [unclassified Phyllobacterium]|uniref:HK97-gp10 family putative phage morphogenesis protein n=1 Tax=unclassified Phyllobacterium TaxID=2638441 RepID=UPI003012ABF5
MAISGLKRLNKKFALLPKVARDAIRDAMAKSADEIVALMKSLVPKDSGELVESIGWTWDKAPDGSVVVAVATASDMTITIYAGSDAAYYARWVEFGTQKKSAQPFFFVAYRALRKRTKSRISRATTKAARKVAAS